MANEYADLPTLLAQLGAEPGDTNLDGLLRSALEAASRSIDRATGRRFYLDAAPSARRYNPRERTARETDGERLLVDDMGAEPTTVETGSGASWSVVAAGQYEAGPDNALADSRPLTSLLALSSYWDTGGTGRVRVTARWGWPAVPPEIAQATLIQANRLFKRKNSPEGVMGSAEWGVVRLSRRDPDVWNLIEPYMLPGMA
ncbi:phage gp6-like head-tail connector protein [Streptomyces sp. NPDC001941]|uniref:phage gp6-like head-tail connector protein n=1 Tax=Streptomyces sp. NPDC001941 TaxID=3154659 RepID=UPI00332DEE90